MGAGHSPHKVRPIFDKRTAQRPENRPRELEPKKNTGTRNPGEEQPEEGEEEKEAQVVGRASGALGRVYTVANIQGKGKSTHPQKNQEEEDPEGYQRRPEKQIDPQRERQEKESGGKKGQEPGRINRERESRQGQFHGPGQLPPSGPTPQPKLHTRTLKEEKEKDQGPQPPGQRGRNGSSGTRLRNRGKRGWGTIA